MAGPVHQLDALPDDLGRGNASNQPGGARDGADGAGVVVPGLIPPRSRGRSSAMLGDLAVGLGFADRATVDEAVSTAREQRRRTGEVLVATGVLTKEQLARVLAERFGLDFVDLQIFPIDMGAVGLIDGELARRYEAVPIEFLDDRRLRVAMADPSNLLTTDDITMLTGLRVVPSVATSEDIRALLTRVTRLDDSVSEVDETTEDEPLLAPDESDQEAPAIRLVHSIIAQAVEQGASDIHFDTAERELRVLFRIDGVIQPVATISARTARRAISRIKVMASLDIAERRLPQDGRIALTVHGRPIELRVVTLPLTDGEGLVIRILDTGLVVRDLRQLGMAEGELRRLTRAVHQRRGATLVTGPTGSGKSTTLYGAVGVVNTGDVSIITIEDPVESRIAGVKQMSVNTKVGMTFAAGLRAMLRADPDVIMVGEIRDRETAAISMQAAITGHLVLSTLHTRDAPSAPHRLLDMGVEPFMVASAVDCVVAQRLMRKLCDECKRPVALPANVVAEMGLAGAEIYEAVGCRRCSGTGYRGRVGAFEVMQVSDRIRELIMQRRSSDEIAAAACDEGMRRMQQDGMDKVRSGVTSMTELARVTSLD